MPSYDFKQLSPYDFEELARDLIQARDKIILESFKSGRDGGIDFRVARGSHNTIVQCKHYNGTGLAGLLSSLCKESSKVQTLKPTRYILVTSVGLTPSNKDDIAKIFAPYLSTGDIISQNDLNNLLTLFPSVEMTHYKLWLASKVVLDRVLNNASVTQSEFDAQRVHRDVQRYVSSEALPRAIHMLETEHVAIISGAPGVGKTSLAKMLLFTYLEKGYELISIVDGFRSGRERFQQGKKQIFYFDDFIGATFLGESGSSFTRNEDREILDFIELVQCSANAVLIMTTREHILRQAIAISEKLKHSTIIDKHCILEISDYSQIQRALILYNHIYFSDLPHEYVSALIKDRYYSTIVKHAKFNPRLIEWLSSYHRIKSIPATKYRDFINNLLENPAEIWSHAYENQISDAARSTLLALYLCGGKTDLKNLERCYGTLHLIRSKHYGFRTQPSDWRRSLAEVNGSFVRPGTKFEFINPSVLDMLNEVIRLDTSNLADLMQAIDRFPQLNRIWKLSQASGNTNISEFLLRESDTVEATLERTIKAPKVTEYQPDINYYFSNSREGQTGLILQIASKIRTNRIQEIAHKALQALIDDWSTGSEPNIISGAEVFKKLHESNSLLPNHRDHFLDRIIDLLIDHSQTNPEASELCTLLEILPKRSCSSRATRLGEAIERYLDENFKDELSEIGSVSDCESFEENLTVLGEAIEVDVSLERMWISEKISELEAYQDEESSYEYESWKDNRHAHIDSAPSIDELFNTLGGSGS